MNIFISIVVLVLLYTLWVRVLRPHFALELNTPKFEFKKFFNSQEQLPLMSPRVEVISEEDIRMFDDVAKLLFEKQLVESDFQKAEQIQSTFLNKMPAKTSTKIQQFDLAEWSIIWEFRNQSLEYYVSRYGVFFTHTDAQNVEHKLSCKFSV